MSYINLNQSIGQHLPSIANTLTNYFDKQGARKDVEGQRLREEQEGQLQNTLTNLQIKANNTLGDDGKPISVSQLLKQDDEAFNQFLAVSSVATRDLMGGMNNRELVDFQGGLTPFQLEDGSYALRIRRKDGEDGIITRGATDNPDDPAEVFSRDELVDQVMKPAIYKRGVDNMAANMETMLGGVDMEEVGGGPPELVLYDKDNNVIPRDSELYQEFSTQLGALSQTTEVDIADAVSGFNNTLISRQQPTEESASPEPQTGPAPAGTSTAYDLSAPPPIAAGTAGPDPRQNVDFLSVPLNLQSSGQPEYIDELEDIIAGAPGGRGQNMPGAPQPEPQTGPPLGAAGGRGQNTPGAPQPEPQTGPAPAGGRGQNTPGAPQPEPQTGPAPAGLQEPTGEALDREKIAEYRADQARTEASRTERDSSLRDRYNNRSRRPPLNRPQRPPLGTSAADNELDTNEELPEATAAETAETLQQPGKVELPGGQQISKAIIRRNPSRLVANPKYTLAQQAAATALFYKSQGKVMPAAMLERFMNRNDPDWLRERDLRLTKAELDMEIAQRRLAGVGLDNRIKLARLGAPSESQSESQKDALKRNGEAVEGYFDNWVSAMAPRLGERIYQGDGSSSAAREGRVEQLARESIASNELVLRNLIGIPFTRPTEGSSTSGIPAYERMTMNQTIAMTNMLESVIRYHGSVSEDPWFGAPEYTDSRGQLDFSKLPAANSTQVEANARLSDNFAEIAAALDRERGINIFAPDGLQQYYDYYAQTASQQ